MIPDIVVDLDSDDVQVEERATRHKTDAETLGEPD
jgi:hypothetical protein